MSNKIRKKKTKQKLTADEKMRRRDPNTRGASRTNRKLARGHKSNTLAVKGK
jgi:predicted rRNA methylase YqxC with S4 and FtsJ domains